MATRNFLVAALGVAAVALFLAGCEKLYTGEALPILAVSENEAGGYGPVIFALAPEMSPVAINFSARHGYDPSELDKWNDYRATLSRNGQEIAAGLFSINHTGTLDMPDGSPYIIDNMLTVRVDEPGDYELVITPTKPVEVKLHDTRIEVRRNIQDVDGLYSQQPSRQRMPGG